MLYNSDRGTLHMFGCPSLRTMKVPLIDSGIETRGRRFFWPGETEIKEPLESTRANSAIEDDPPKLCGRCLGEPSDRLDRTKRADSVPPSRRLVRFRGRFGRGRGWLGLSILIGVHRGRRTLRIDGRFRWRFTS